MSSLIGSVWRERDNRFVRLVEVVSDDGVRIGRRTLYYRSVVTGNPKEEGPFSRVTRGDRAKFLKGFVPHEDTATTHSAKEEGV